MTFLWTRSAGAIQSVCVLCGMSTRSLSEHTIYPWQRAHDAMTCQRRRAERAYANSPEGQAEARARAGDGWVAERDEMLCVTTVFGVVPGVETGRMDLAKTNRPTRERRTVLSAPSALNGKEAVDS
jgi:hypothetical protein